MVIQNLEKSLSHLNYFHDDMPTHTKYIQNSNSRLHVLRVEFQTYPIQQSKPEGINMNKENVFEKQ